MHLDCIGFKNEAVRKTYLEKNFKSSYKKTHDANFMYKWSSQEIYDKWIKINSKNLIHVSKDVRID